MRELVYLSRAKLDAFAPRHGLLGRIKQSNVEVSVPGLRVVTNASADRRALPVPWDHLRAVERDLRKRALDLGGSRLEPGVWIRFNRRMTWATGDEITAQRNTGSGLVLFASVDPAEAGTALLLCGSERHLLSYGGAADPATGRSVAASRGGAVLRELGTWLSSEEGPAVAAKSKLRTASGAAKWAHRTLSRQLPNPATRLSGYARVIDLTAKEHNAGVELVFATPLVVEYTPMPHR